MSILNLLTLFAFIALNLDIIFQIIRVRKTKSSKDLSLLGLIIRFIAIIIILIKYIALRDTTLVLGQALIAVTFTIYFSLAILYFFRRKKLR
jgi:uncharacterized protein with PQ loop repeat